MKRIDIFITSLVQGNGMTSGNIFFMAFSVVIGILFVVGCTPQTSQDDLIIKAGSWGGRCEGYCTSETIITSEKIIYNRSGRSPKGQLPELIEEIPISVEQWNALLGSLDFKVFSSLDDVFGCPNCADGGTQWITVDNGKTTKTVTFESGDTIPEIENFMIEVRKARGAIGPMTYDRCVRLGGHQVGDDIVSPRCSDDEASLGLISDVDCFCICCK